MAALSRGREVEAKNEYKWRPLVLRSSVRCIAMSRSGAVLTGHDDGTVCAFTPSGTPCSLASDEASPIGGGSGTVKMHNTAVTCLVPSLGGGVWTMSAAGSVRFITPGGYRSDLELKAPGKKRAHNSAIAAAALTPEGTLWTAAVILRVWTSGGEWRQSLQTHAGKVLSMVAIDARVWVGHQDGRVLVFDAFTAVCIAKLQDDGRHSAVLSLCAVGSRVFSGDSKGILRVLSSTTMRLELEGQMHSKRLAVASLAASSDSKNLWVGLDGGVLLRLPLHDAQLAGDRRPCPPESSLKYRVWFSLPLAVRELSAGGIQAHRARVVGVLPILTTGIGGDEALWSAGKGEKSVCLWTLHCPGVESSASDMASDEQNQQNTSEMMNASLLGPCRSQEPDDTCGSGIERVLFEGRNSKVGGATSVLEDAGGTSETGGMRRVMQWGDLAPHAVNSLISVGNVFVSGDAGGVLGVWAPGGSRVAPEYASNGQSKAEHSSLGAENEMDGTFGRDTGASSRNSNLEEFYVATEPSWGSPHTILRGTASQQGDATVRDEETTVDPGKARRERRPTFLGDGCEVDNSADDGVGAGAGGHKGADEREGTSLSSTGHTSVSAALATADLAGLFRQNASRLDSRGSFFATPDASLPQSPHAALGHARAFSMLSPLSDNNSVHVSSAAEDTWTLSPDPAMGPRRWSCQHRVDVGGCSGNDATPDSAGLDGREPNCLVAVHALAAAPLPGGGQLLAVCLANGVVQVWDCVTWSCVGDTLLSSPPAAPLWRLGPLPGSPAALFVACASFGVLMLVPPAPSVRASALVPGPMPWEVRLLDSGAEGSSDGTPLCLAWHGQAGNLLAGTDHGLVQVWDSMAYTVQERLSHQGPVHAVSSAGGLVICATPDAIVLWTLLPTGSWARVATTEVHPEQAPMALVPVTLYEGGYDETIGGWIWGGSGGTLMVGCWDGTVQRWSLELPSNLPSGNDDHSRGRSCANASGYEDEHCTVHGGVRLELVAEYRGAHAGPVNCAAWVQEAQSLGDVEYDGRRGMLVTGGSDGILLAWALNS